MGLDDLQESATKCHYDGGRALQANFATMSCRLVGHEDNPGSDPMAIRVEGCAIQDDIDCEYIIGVLARNFPGWVKLAFRVYDSIAAPIFNLNSIHNLNFRSEFNSRS